MRMQSKDTVTGFQGNHGKRSKDIVRINHSSSFLGTQRARIFASHFKLYLKMRFLGFICVFFSMIAGGCNGKSGGVVDKTLPPVRPETPKRILFVHNLFANTELNQMLLIADELRARGHYCKFLMVNQVEKKVRDKGFDFRGMDDKLDGGKFAEILGKLSVSKKWYEYVGGFGEFATTMAKGYETALLDIRDELVSNNNTKKQYDLVYTSMFSDMAVDLASHYNIPFVIHYACTMGAIFDYHDSVGAPDAFLVRRQNVHSRRAGEGSGNISAFTHSLH